MSKCMCKVVMSYPAAAEVEVGSRTEWIGVVKQLEFVPAEQKRGLIKFAVYLLTTSVRFG